MVSEVRETHGNTHGNSRVMECIYTSYVNEVECSRDVLRAFNVILLCERNYRYKIAKEQCVSEIGEVTNEGSKSWFRIIGVICRNVC